MMGRQRATNQPRSACARPKLLYRLAGCFLERSLVCQAQIIVRREIKKRFALQVDLRTLWRIDAAQFAVQPLCADNSEARLQLFIASVHTLKMRHECWGKGNA